MLFRFRVNSGSKIIAMKGFSRLALTAVLALALPGIAAADTVKIGISKLFSQAAVPLAIERGYFKEQGLDVEMVFFDAAQPIAVAVASGDVDFGVAGMSAGFFSLASQGQLRLIGSSTREKKGFYSLIFLTSNKAAAAGLKTAKDLPGHDIAITQVGTSLHYSIGQVAERNGFAMSTVSVKPLQSNSNVVSALTGGTVDAAVMPGSSVLPMLSHGDIQLLGWIGDLAPGSSGSSLFTATKIANGRGEVVTRFMAGYRKGMRDFHDAFATADDERRNGPSAAGVLKAVSAFTGVSAEELDKAVPYGDPDARMDAADVARQINWYKSQNLLKGDIKADSLIDNRYALFIPPAK
jgi:NitT/TauT family transport system substrate-binding protein